MTTIDPPLIAQHLAAAALMWLVAVVAGWPISRLLPRSFSRGEALAACPLLGAAFWACSLYLFPFWGGIVRPGGLVVIIGVAAALVARRLTARRAMPCCDTPAASSSWPAAAILASGCLAYITPLLTQYVPPGMDASMYATNARIIAVDMCLPSTCAPVTAEIPFSAVNQGLPTLAALAGGFGLPPLAGTIAASHFTFSCLILATWLLLRLVVHPTPAAVLAVATCWFARAMQNTIEWGGFPTVLSLAVGLLVARLIVDAASDGRRRAALPLGVAAASMVFLHAVSAGLWLVIAMPVALVAAMARSAKRRSAAACLAIAAAVAAGVLAAGALAARPVLSSRSVEIARQWQSQYAPAGEGRQFAAAAASAIAAAVDDNLAWAACAAVVWLLIRRQWRAASLVAAPLILIAMVLINSRKWFLPGSWLLYPDRALYWASPLAAVALALAWRVRPRQLSRRYVAAVVATALLIVAATRHVQYFQRRVAEPVHTQQAWEALRWAEANLPRGSFVASAYGASGGYLPCAAGIPATGWHLHLDQLDAFERMRTATPPTHVFIVEPSAARDKVARLGLAQDSAWLESLVRQRDGEVVFSNKSVKIYRLMR